MNKYYNINLERLTLGDDITRDELMAIISQADSKISQNNSVDDKIIRLQAKSLLEEVIELSEIDDIPEYEKNPYLLVRYALISFSNGNNNDALEYLNKAISIKEDYAYAYNCASKILSDIDDDYQSIEYSSRAIMIDHKYHLAYYNRGIAKNYIGGYESAVEDFRLAIRFKKDPGYYNALGDALYNLGHYKTAINAYSDAIRINPNNITAIDNRGDCYLELKDRDKYQKAEADYLLAKGIDKTNYLPYQSLGLLYEKRIKNKDLEKALKYYIEGSKLKDADTCLFHQIGRIYFKQGDITSAIEHYKKTLKIDPNLECVISELFENRLIWDLNINLLNSSDNYFVDIVSYCIKNKLNTPQVRELIRSTFILWSSLRCEADTSSEFLYQYTSKFVLKNICKTKYLRLTPAIYQNDPMEGRALIEYISNGKHCDERSSELIKRIIESQNSISNQTVFIRSFTTERDSLIMWDSSYAENAEGISIGIKQRYLSRGCESIIKRKDSRKNSNTLNNKTGRKDDTAKNIPLTKVGLYEVLYLPDGNSRDIDNSEFKNFIESFSKADFSQFDESLASILINKILQPISHIIKDGSYKHEKEYRLMCIENIEESEYVMSDFESGIFINTEPFLFIFENQETVIFGPKVDGITASKINHFCLANNIHPQFDKSNIRFR